MLHQVAVFGDTSPSFLHREAENCFCKESSMHFLAEIAGRWSTVRPKVSVAAHTANMQKPTTQPTTSSYCSFPMWEFPMWELFPQSFPWSMPDRSQPAPSQLPLPPNGYKSEPIQKHWQASPRSHCACNPLYWPQQASECPTDASRSHFCFLEATSSLIGSYLGDASGTLQEGAACRDLPGSTKWVMVMTIWEALL